MQSVRPSRTQQDDTTNASKVVGGNDDDDDNSVSTDTYKPFPEMLYEMVMTESKRGNASPIRWVYKGEAFVIDTFQPRLNNMLRKYFSHGRYTSLQKQLNMYGFKKGREGKYDGAYFHPSFRKDKRASLAKIKRRPPPGRNRGGGKLGTRKRKVKRRNSGASESSSLLREAALVKTNGTQETYYYGSDISTTNENSTLGDDQYLDLDNYSEAVVVGNNMQGIPARNSPPPGRFLPRYDYGQGNVGAPVGEIFGTPKKQQQQQQQPTTNKIVLPMSLKKVIMLSWENLRHRQLIFDLPAAVSVKKALDMYLELKFNLVCHQSFAKNSEERERIKRRKAGWIDMTEGIVLFFDKAIESRLLYRQELPQYKAIISSSEKTPSDIYGCEHLLRLLLRLPDILAECVSEEKRKRILHDMVEFVRFLHQHQEAVFNTSFRALTNEEQAAITN